MCSVGLYQAGEVLDEVEQIEHGWVQDLGQFLVAARPTQEHAAMVEGLRASQKIHIFSNANVGRAHTATRLQSWNT